MTVEEYLIQNRGLDKEINCKLEEIAKLRALATKVSPATGCGSSGEISDKVGKNGAKIVDLEREINEEIDKLTELKIEFHRKINELPESLHRTILSRKFILNEPLELIAEKIGYSVPQIKRIYKKAKENLEKMIPNDAK